MTYNSRNWDSPEYKAWRKSVRRRDKNRCQMPGCGSRKKTYCHHIQPWANAPLLRYEVSNGILLCYNCHKMVTGCEFAYVSLFISIVADKNE